MTVFVQTNNHQSGNTLMCFELKHLLLLWQQLLNLMTSEPLHNCYPAQFICSHILISNIIFYLFIK